MDRRRSASDLLVLFHLAARVLVAVGVLAFGGTASQKVRQHGGHLCYLTGVSIKLLLEPINLRLYRTLYFGKLSFE
eukprot:COSAG01_NODE_4615_length_4877_cov_52.080185_4_plen_76_part_00